MDAVLEPTLGLRVHMEVDPVPGRDFCACCGQDIAQDLCPSPTLEIPWEDLKRPAYKNLRLELHERLLDAVGEIESW